MAINPNVSYTYRDYINLEQSEVRRYELIDGEICVVPSPTPKHQQVVLNIASILREFVISRDIGRVSVAPLDVVLSDEDVLQPDIIFIARERLGIVGEQNIQGAPDLVIEVLSPGTADRDRTIKRARYARFGVREYWLVEPISKTVEVLKASQEGFETVRVYPEGTHVESPVLPDLRLDVNNVFV